MSNFYMCIFNFYKGQWRNMNNIMFLMFYTGSRSTSTGSSSLLKALGIPNDKCFSWQKSDFLGFSCLLCQIHCKHINLFASRNYKIMSLQITFVTDALTEDKCVQWKHISMMPVVFLMQIHDKIKGIVRKH